MKTFWLYYGETIVDSVRCKADATPDEVKRHSWENNKKVPGIVKNPHLIPFSTVCE